MQNRGKDKIDESPQIVTLFIFPVVFFFLECCYKEENMAFGHEIQRSTSELSKHSFSIYEVFFPFISVLFLANKPGQEVRKPVVLNKL